MNNTAPIMDKALLTLENTEDIEKYFNDQARFHFTKLNVETIDDFNGDFGFLNNEYDAEVYYEGLLYPNVYAAYQAARSQSVFLRKQISESKTSYEVYTLSQQIEDPKDWPSRRLKVMEMLIRDKFTRHEDLKQELLATRLRILVNSYAHETESNIFWGKVKNKGSNYLGIILMNVREEVIKNKNILIWLHTNINLPKVKQLYPEFKVKLFIQDQLIKIDSLEDKSYYYIGSSKNDDAVIIQEGIQKHIAVLAFDINKGLVIVKTQSSIIMRIKEQELPFLIPTTIKNKSTIRIANNISIHIECLIQKIQDYFQKKQKDMEYELENLKSQATNQNNHEIVLTSYGISEDKTLFITGFRSITDNELRNIFKVFGEIDTVKIPIDKYSGKNRGIAFIKFYNSQSAQMALKTPLYHNDQKLIIKIADKKNISNEELDKRSKKQVETQKVKRERSLSKESSKSYNSISSISSNSSFNDGSSLSSCKSENKRHKYRHRKR